MSAEQFRASILDQAQLGALRLIVARNRVGFRFGARHASLIRHLIDDLEELFRFGRIEYQEPYVPSKSDIAFYAHAMMREGNAKDRRMAAKAWKRILGVARDDSAFQRHLRRMMRERRE